MTFRTSAVQRGVAARQRQIFVGWMRCAKLPKFSTTHTTVTTYYYYELHLFCDSIVTPGSLLLPREEWRLQPGSPDFTTGWEPWTIQTTLDVFKATDASLVNHINHHRCPFSIGWLINRGVWRNPFKKRKMMIDGIPNYMWEKTKHPWQT